MKKINVPLFIQKESECGPTALKMVFAYYNKNVSTKEIVEFVGGLKDFGTRTIDLAQFSKEKEFKTTCYSYNQELAQEKAEIKKPNINFIIKFLKKEIPVIISVRSFLLYNSTPSKMGHFIVITHYEKNVFTYNDPFTGKEATINETDLLFAWHNNILQSSGYFLVLEK